METRHPSVFILPWVPETPDLVVLVFGSQDWLLYAELSKKESTHMMSCEEWQWGQMS